MSAIFISYRSSDREVAAELSEWLQSRGHWSVFLDYDPEDGIPAGRSWEREIYHRLRACRAVIVVCSEASLASKWCFAEVTHARALGKHLLPVRIDDCAVHELIADRQIVDLTATGSMGTDGCGRGCLRRVWIQRRRSTGMRAARHVPGMLAFQERDAAVFFGRTEETTRGLDLLNRQRRLGNGGVVLVVGASGSGKSSLVRAGLVPRLRKDQERWLVADPIRPRDDPFRELAGALSRAFDRVGVTRPWMVVHSELAGPGVDTTRSEALVAMATELRMLADRPEARVLLVVDQLEELLDPDQPASDFLQTLRGALCAPDSPVELLGSLRSDFLGELERVPARAGLDYEPLLIGPLSVDGITQIIEEPAKMAGVDLEPGLVQAVIDDSRADDALPLLAFTLRELYERFGDDYLLTVDEYLDGLGGLQESVGRVASEAVDPERLTFEELDQLRRSLLAMVRLSEDGRWVKRAVRWDVLPRQARPSLERLVRARLLVSSGDGHSRTLDVAHEALFRSWDLLTQWLDEDAEALRLRREVERASQAWVDSGHDAAYLWRGTRLARVEHVRATEQLLSDDELPSWRVRGRRSTPRQPAPLASAADGS